MTNRTGRPPIVADKSTAPFPADFKSKYSSIVPISDQNFRVRPAYVSLCLNRDSSLSSTNSMLVPASCGSGL
jgi:hypothetical protein